MSYIFCNTEKKLEMNKIISNTERLISISALSKLMTFQFEEEEIKNI